MKNLMTLVFLTMGAASPVFADKPNTQPKTISLWDQEQDRLRHKIEELQKQLKAAEELLKKRTANREQYEKQRLEAEQHKFPKKTEQPTHESTDDKSASQILGFKTPPTWKQFLEAICENYEVELEADEYPTGTVDLQEVDSQADEAFEEWLVQKLSSKGFSFWERGNKLRLANSHQRGTPCLDCGNPPNSLRGVS